MTPNVWGQGKMDVQLKQRVHLPLLWLFSSVRPSDGMTEWCPPALVCVTFFTQSIKSMLISSFDNQLKLLIRSILPFLWLSLVYQSVSEHIIYYIDDFNCFFPIVVSLTSPFLWELALENWKVLVIICFIFWLECLPCFTVQNTTEYWFHIDAV